MNIVGRAERQLAGMEAEIAALKEEVERRRTVFVGSVLTADERALPFAVGHDLADVVARTCEVAQAAAWARQRARAVTVARFHDGHPVAAPASYTLDGDPIP